MAHARITKLQIDLKTPVIITNPQDLLYLTGRFLIDGGFLFISNKDVVLFGGHLEQINGLKTDTLSNLGKYIGRYKTIEIDKNIRLSWLDILKNYTKGIKLKPIDSPVTVRRLLKDGYELASMKEAYDITVKVFAQVKKELAKQTQKSEKELAQFIRMAGIKLGAHDESFPTIVASGANAAIPHHLPTDKILKPKESIILDFGFKVDGYCSDFTRTVFLKEATDELEDMYRVAEKAYHLAVARVTNNREASEVDLIAREYIDKKGYGEYFIHNLGHGTGIDVHEGPSLHERSKDILQNKMVFSIEPGIYIPKVGGIRIEDLVYLKEGKANYFARVSTKFEDMIIK